MLDGFTLLVVLYKYSQQQLCLNRLQMELYTLFLLWLAFGVVDTLQTGLLLTQERKYFGSGDLKIPNEVTMTDNHQNSELS